MMEDSRSDKTVDSATNGLCCLIWLGIGVVELLALLATWGTGHFWIALFFPPYGGWITIAWLFDLPPFPLT